MLARFWWQLVRFGFRLLYYEMAFTYDAVSWIVSLGQWRCWQRSAMNFLGAPADGVILELAHGTGNLQIDLQTANYQTIAFDLSPYMGRIARQKIAKHNLNQDFVRGSALQLPFADSSISHVVCTFPTDFIVQQEALTEVNRILREHGKLIVVLNGILVGGGVIKSLLEWLYRITGQRDDTRQQDIEHFFLGYGFDVETQEIECQRSLAQLVILTKRVDSNPKLL